MTENLTLQTACRLNLSIRRTAVISVLYCICEELAEAVCMHSGLSECLSGYQIPSKLNLNSAEAHIVLSMKYDLFPGTLWCLETVDVEVV